jgi:hypothetical protein
MIVHKLLRKAHFLPLFSTRAAYYAPLKQAVKKKKTV